MKDFIKINENDNVIVAIKELAEGEKVTVDGKEYTAAETIPAGHKMAICDIPQGGDVIKYGSVGACTQYQNSTRRSAHLYLRACKNRGEKDRGAYLYGICTSGRQRRCA